MPPDAASLTSRPPFNARALMDGGKAMVGPPADCYGALVRGCHRLCPRMTTVPGASPTERPRVKDVVFWIETTFWPPGSAPYVSIEGGVHLPTGFRRSANPKHDEVRVSLR